MTNDATADEVYELADEALAHHHSMRKRANLEMAGQLEEDVKTVEKNLELIRRRMDPAARGDC
jgi:uncharacterized protein YicC (UPF0701 family)